MHKKILVLLVLFLLTGCYDHKELNTIAILTAAEINKVDNEFIIKAQVVNPQSPDKTTTVQAPFIIYEGKGKTIHEAYRNIKMQSSRYLYPSHMQILIINEKLAKENIGQIIDFFLRLPNIRTEFNVLIGKNDDILSITTPIDIVSSTSILETMEINSKYLGVTSLITLNELANMELDKNLEITLPSIESIDNNKEAETTENTNKTKIESMYKLSNLAIFKGNKLKGYLTKEQSIAYNLIKNQTEAILITNECEKEKYMTFEANKTKADISAKNKTINIDISLKGNINESMCKIKLNNPKNIDKIEKQINEQIEKLVKSSIENVRKEYNTDIFGFLDLIYKTDYDTYKKIKDNWYEDEFKNLKINVKVSTEIVGKGNVLEGNNEKN